MIKRRLFLTYVGLGLVLIFFVYSLNTIYVDRYEIDDTAPSDLSGDVRPPDPFPQGKPDFRRKKQDEEEQKRQEELEREQSQQDEQREHEQVQVEDENENANTESKSDDAEETSSASNQ